ncbi:hypothetical protein [Paenibacillus sp. UMB4589-SE434]|uniref:hypothetical protein n=1 Tax=Paenibacillus sp. UMB4589-SE434 TaxID=3046314 RepID=UPI00254B1D6B|nr:hypothetical protein [Paenibacillus sp. UMB4589-SE434]MDK8179417.1 hypothetical protein [Paenibacillus sp. UMB4589-SE434]
MRYGVREICNVVLKDVKTQEPVVYLESLKTSALETKGTTVYARGGRGNAKLIGWDSEKEITMNMEDTLISKEGLEVLTGSKFTAASKPVHKKEVLRVQKDGTDLSVKLATAPTANVDVKSFFYKSADGAAIGEKLTAAVTTTGTPAVTKVVLTGASIKEGDIVIADYYLDAPVSAKSITIASDVFPGTYTLEGETLWRNEDGVDVPAVFTIPKLKVLPNFNINMAATGDPTPFTFSTEVLKDSSSTAMVVIDLLEE